MKSSKELYYYEFDFSSLPLLIYLKLADFHWIGGRLEQRYEKISLLAVIVI